MLILEHIHANFTWAGIYVLYELIITGEQSLSETVKRDIVGVRIWTVDEGIGSNVAIGSGWLVTIVRAEVGSGWLVTIVRAEVGSGWLVAIVRAEVWNGWFVTVERAEVGIAWLLTTGKIDFDCLDDWLLTNVCVDIGSGGFVTKACDKGSGWFVTKAKVGCGRFVSEIMV